MLSMGHFARDIAEQFHHSASYFSEEHAERLVANLREIQSIDWAQSKDLFERRKAELLLSYGYDPSGSDRKPFAFAAGAAIIPVHGILLNRFSGSYSFATGYNFIRSQRFAALADDDVKLIVYDYNTYGGHAAGCGELSKEMFDSRAVKPSLAVIDSNCYSAGIFLASAQDRIVASPSSGCGSIGCVAMHVDYSEMLKNEGVKITFIKSADPKTDGNPYEPLSSRAKKSIQRSVDYHATQFIDAVARNRKMEESDVRATEARCFDPPEALEYGLIDAISPPSEAILASLSSIEGGTSTMQTQTSKDGDNNANSSPAPATMTAEQISAAIASGIATALPAALTAHENAKRERRSSIMGLDEAKNRQKLAAHLADNTALSVDDAKGLLANAAEESEPAKGGRNAFREAMNRTANPTVGADGPGNGVEGGGEGEPNDVDMAARLQQDFVSATGQKVIPIKKTG